MVMENLEEPGTASKAKLPRRGAKYVIMMLNDHELEDEKLARLCGRRSHFYTFLSKHKGWAVFLLGIVS